MGDKTREEVPSIFLAAEAVAGNEDLLLQILLRVPVRPLIRFKLVSKPWKALISGEEFGRNHTCIGSLTGTKPHLPSGLYFYTSRQQQQLLSVSLSADNHGLSLPSLSTLLEAAALSNCKLKVLQSCNGLLLCSITRPYTDRDVESYYMVLNPTIMETKVVPFPKRNSADVDKVKCCRFFFDPVESPHFKVICLKDLGPHKSEEESNTFNTQPHEILIYSSESNLWRSFGNFVPPEGILSDTGVLCNGIIYWFGNYYLVRFHTDSMNMTSSSMFPQLFDPWLIMYFGECGGHLHLIIGRCEFAMVLELNKDRLKWFYKYRFDLREMESAVPNVVRNRFYDDGPKLRFAVLTLIRGDTKEDSSLVFRIPGKVISYNLYFKSFKVLAEIEYEDIDEYADGNLTAHQYIETLSPLNAPFSLHSLIQDMNGNLSVH